MNKPDLDNNDNIKLFVESFYEKVFADELLAPIFLDIAKIDVDEHLEKIRHYWQKMLLKDPVYKRHMMNFHRAVHNQSPFTDEAFARWLSLFKKTATEEFAGERTQRAIYLADLIANNMNVVLNEKKLTKIKRPA